MARAMSLMLMFILLAPMIAPVIGGYLLVWLGWRAIFWTLVICGFIAVLVVLVGLSMDYHVFVVNSSMRSPEGSIVASARNGSVRSVQDRQE